MKGRRARLLYADFQEVGGLEKQGGEGALPKSVTKFYIYLFRLPLVYLRFAPHLGYFCKRYCLMIDLGSKCLLSTTIR